MAEDKVNMSLEDIIKLDRRSKRGASRGGFRTARGRGGRGGFGTSRGRGGLKTRGVHGVSVRGRSSLGGRGRSSGLLTRKSTQQAQLKVTRALAVVKRARLQLALSTGQRQRQARDNLVNQRRGIVPISAPSFGGDSWNQGFNGRKNSRGFLRTVSGRSRGPRRGGFRGAARGNRGQSSRLGNFFPTNSYASITSAGRGGRRMLAMDQEVYRRPMQNNTRGNRGGFRSRGRGRNDLQLLRINVRNNAPRRSNYQAQQEQDYLAQARALIQAQKESRGGRGGRGRGQGSWGRPRGRGQGRINYY